MEILQILVDHQADEKIAARLKLFAVGKFAKGLGQDFVGGAVGDLLDEITLGLGYDPALADGSAALRNQRQQLHRPAHSQGHAAFLIDAAVQINLRRLLGGIPGGQPAHHGPARKGGIPSAQESLGIQMKRIRENQPAVHPVRREARFQAPVGGAAAGLLDLLLVEAPSAQFRPRQGKKRQGHAGLLFPFASTDDQTGAGATGQQRHLAMHADQFENLGGHGKILRRHENQPQRHLGGAQLLAQINGPIAHPGVVEFPLPKP